MSGFELGLLDMWSHSLNWTVVESFLEQVFFLIFVHCLFIGSPNILLPFNLCMYYEGNLRNKKDILNLYSYKNMRILWPYIL